jgi:hypothetical protein
MAHSNKNSGKFGFLRLVQEAENESPKLSGPSFQLGLFPQADPHILSFIHSGFLKRNSIFDVIKKSGPVCIFDIRASPSFRSFDLNRVDALVFFERNFVDYIDVAGVIGAKNVSDRSLDAISNFVCGHIIGMGRRSGPSIMIFDNFDLMTSLVDIVPSVLEYKLCEKIRAQVFVGERGNGLSEV